MKRIGEVLRGRSGTVVRVLGVAVVGLLGAVLGNLFQGEAADQLASGVGWLLIALLATVIILVVLQVRSVLILLDIRERRRFSINYYPGTTEHQLLDLHVQAAKVIREASDDVEIYAVNSYVEVFTDPESARVQRAQRDYLREYENKFRRVSYHRLIQLRHGQPAGGNGKPLSSLISLAYLEHYRAMVRHAEDHPGSRIKIEEVQARLPISFVLVKDKYGDGGMVIWQMNEHAPSPELPDALRISGVFIVTDPDGLLVRYFLNWFHVLDRGYVRALTKEDLEDVVSARRA